MNRKRHSRTPDFSLERGEDWLRTHSRLVLGLVVLCAVVVRVIYLVQLQDEPLRSTHQYANSDMAFFAEWADLIAAGDWWTDRSLHPHHDWHLELAQETFAQFPAELKRVQDEAGRELSPEEASQALWARWYHHKRFHQEPLYPYLLAIGQRCFGRNVQIIYGLQMLVGVLTVVLIHKLTANIFGPLTGLCAAILALGCSPLLFYEGLLLRESLLAAVSITLAWLTCAGLSGQRGLWWLATGVAFGIALMLKVTLVFQLIPALIVAATTTYRTSRDAAVSANSAPAKSDGAASAPATSPGLHMQSALTCVAALLLGCLIGMSPAMIRNVSVGLSPFDPTSVGTITFVAANTVDAEMGRGFFVSNVEAARIMHESDGQFGSAIKSVLASHTPSTLLRLMWQKLSCAWHWYEPADNASFYYFRRIATVLQLPVTFAWLAPLGLVGMALAHQSWRRSWPVYLIVASGFATMLVFYPCSRFRAPLLPGIIPFAAVTIVALFQSFAKQEFRRVAAYSAAIVAVACWTGRPLNVNQELIRWYDVGPPYLQVFQPLVTRSLEVNDYPTAAAALRSALRIQPDALERVPQQGLEPTVVNIEAAAAFAKLYQDCGQLLTAAGRNDEATFYFDQARRITAAVDRAAVELERLAPVAAPMPSSSPP